MKKRKKANASSALKTPAAVDFVCKCVEKMYGAGSPRPDRKIIDHCLKYRRVYKEAARAGDLDTAAHATLEVGRNYLYIGLYNLEPIIIEEDRQRVAIEREKLAREIAIDRQKRSVAARRSNRTDEDLVIRSVWESIPKDQRKISVLRDELNEKRDLKRDKKTLSASLKRTGKSV